MLPRAAVAFHRTTARRPARWRSPSCEGKPNCFTSVHVDGGVWPYQRPDARGLPFRIHNPSSIGSIAAHQRILLLFYVGSARADMLLGYCLRQSECYSRSTPAKSWQRHRASVIRTRLRVSSSTLRTPENVFCSRTLPGLRLQRRTKKPHKTNVCFSFEEWETPGNAFFFTRNT